MTRILRFFTCSLIIISGLFFQDCKAENQSATVISVDRDSQQAVIEVDGKKYKVNLDQVIDENNSQANNSTKPEATAQNNSETKTETPSPDSNAELEKQFAALSATQNKYTGLPVSVSTRLLTMPTDRLMTKGQWGIDFTHRFAAAFADEGAFLGLDSFAYNSIGVHYGLTDTLELHLMRANVGDMLEFGAKAKILQETKDFSWTNPMNVTLTGGFQSDSIQDALDPYVQVILSRSIVPNRIQLFVSPSYAWNTNTIGGPAAIYSSFADSQGRGSGDQGTFAIPIGLSVEVIKNRASIFGEISPVFAGYQENKMGWAAGIQVLSKKETHIWTLGITNMPYVTPGQFIVGGPENDIHLGFNVNIFI